VSTAGLPRIGVYRAVTEPRAPVLRLYVSEDHNLIALQSDAPIASQAVESVADCLTGWIVEQGATPIYLSGLPAERDEGPASTGSRPATAASDSGSRHRDSVGRRRHHQADGALINRRTGRLR